jgi:hypothetical protein
LLNALNKATVDKKTLTPLVIIVTIALISLLVFTTPQPDEKPTAKLNPQTQLPPEIQLESTPQLEPEIVIKECYTGGGNTSNGGREEPPLLINCNDTEDCPEDIECIITGDLTPSP